MIRGYFTILIGFLLYTLSAHGQIVDRAPVELESVSNLLKWSDLVVVVTEDRYHRKVTLDEVVFEGGSQLFFTDTIEVDLNINYEHMQPVLMGGYQYLLFLTRITELEYSKNTKI